MKKLLSILLASLIIMSSLSVINVFAQTDTNQTETAETTDSTSEPTSVATETTEPTTETNEPTTETAEQSTEVTEATELTTEATETSTEVTEVTEPVTDSTETTVPTETTESSTGTVPPTYSDKEIISGDYIYEVIMDNEIKIVDYFGTDTNVIVPAQIDGYDVTVIEGGAFICKSNVESVTLPEGVRYIDNYAFYGCKNLRNVTLPNTLLIIEKAAFRCTKITDIEIPDSVGVIRSNAFARSRLRNIKIGKGINAIEDGALGEEKNLTITGYSNTEAEKYAIRNDVKFISIDEPQPTTTEGTKPTEPVEKKANPVKVTVNNTTVSAKKLESKKQTVKPITVKDAKGTVEVVKVKSGTTSKIYKKITVNKKTGAITFSKGKYAKKTYNIKLKITAKGNSKYKAKVITKTVTVKVKYSSNNLTSW